MCGHVAVGEGASTDSTTVSPASTARPPPLGMTDITPALSAYAVYDEAGETREQSNWTWSRGVVTQTSNVHCGHHCSPSQKGTILYAGSALADYVWSVDVAGEDDDAFGIVFRVADTHNFYKLYKVRNGVQSELWHASTNESYGNGREYTLQVRTDGCRFVGHYRGGEDFDVTDRDCVAAGGVGAYSWGSGGQWSNMLLTTVAGRGQGRRMDPAIAQAVVFGALLAACCAGAFCCLATRYKVARPASSSGLAHGKLFDGVVGGCGDQHELSQGSRRCVQEGSWTVSEAI
ncbi:unnamed protein product [Prorocentrum cordatum]|uniref:Uncharacterized protein n=1 Tax=Prorocentrum cordatum TaxID=2364126 RepID=A0ABN9YDR5_9DINO|nr:unnamed protein product [Polarella glacialis]